AQRGGVTILNNVINPLQEENALVEIDNPSSGNVRVIVMTLDGSVVKYLSKGNLSAGKHKFSWDGRNKSSSTVARGIYFIRVIGNGFDETRKVMVVK
ncbi:MAG: T9SS type A sorting domain-containing protein, partial [Treponema sp.]|nr:T9SS type A sorting domain-containing protein [Treponema sp.]